MKVFLGGTCNNSTWRDDIIPLLKIDYFNPIVENWDILDIEIEEKEKEKCQIHLYVITKDIKGVYSIAEAVESAFNQNKITIFQIVSTDMNKEMLHSVNAVSYLILKKYGISFHSDSFEATASIINNISKGNLL